MTQYTKKVLDHGFVTLRNLAGPTRRVVKDEKHRPRDIRGNKELIRGRERDILLANSEAHRFAITYHRNDRSKQMGLR